MNRLLSAFMVFVTLTFGQTLTVSVNDPRPVHAAVLEIEKLSGQAINYEDLQYNYAADLQEIAGSIMNAAQRAQAPPGLPVIVPKGGPLGVVLGVNAATQRLADSGAVMGALSALLNTANGTDSMSAGKFTVENVDDHFFIVPSQWRSATGLDVTATPLLSTKVTLTGKAMTGWDTLAAILGQISSGSGIAMKLGTMPIGMFATSNVSVTASNEPAGYVLGRLFSAIISSGSTSSTNVPTMGYHLLFEPKHRDYVLNVELVLNPNSDPLPQAGTPAIQTPGFGVRKAASAQP